MATWTVEVRLTGPKGELKTWRRELDQLKANQLYTDAVEALNCNIPM